MCRHRRHAHLSQKDGKGDKEQDQCWYHKEEAAEHQAGARAGARRLVGKLRTSEADLGLDQLRELLERVADQSRDRPSIIAQIGHGYRPAVGLLPRAEDCEWLLGVNELP